MTLKFSPTVFMLVYCIVYCAALLTDLPAFRYYPLTGHLNWGPGKLVGMGPAMAWYGVLFDSAVVGGVLAFVIPGGWLAKGLRNFMWVVPLSAMLFCVFLMRVFFK